MNTHGMFKSPRWVFTTGLLLTLVLALARPGSSARAASHGIVHSLEKELSQAILTANATAGADTITFDSSGTILLSRTLPAITDPAGLTIDGAGQSVIISGNNAVQVMQVSQGAALTLRNLTIAGGHSNIEGGGMINDGTLNVINSTFSGNTVSTHGGGIYNTSFGILNVTNSTFSGNSASGAGINGGGGGIQNYGTLSVTDSTFSENSGSLGGAITNGGRLTVNHSVFSGNSATEYGGVFYNFSTLSITNSTFSANSANNGGAIANTTGNLTVTGSTFAGNSAFSAGGAIHNYSTLSVVNSTFSGNSAYSGSSIFSYGRVTVTNATFSGNAGGGPSIFNGSTLTLQNSIAANSNAVNCLNTGSLINGGGNLSWPDSSCPGINADPLLGPLQDNDGFTQTHALLAGSPAIDSALLATCPATDQRGVSRPQGAGCDMGAYELGGESTPPTISLNTPPEGAVYVLGQVVTADYACQDEAGGSGLASCTGTAPNGSPIDTGAAGTKTFTVSAVDHAGNAASLTHTYRVVYAFSGFFQPVDNLPTINVVRAGLGVPVRFSLGGNQGLGIFAAGYPAFPKIACTGGTPEDNIEETVKAGSSSLSYDAATQTYTYVWVTNAAWSGTCRQLTIRLTDGSEHTANFKFLR